MHQFWTENLQAFLDLPCPVLNFFIDVWSFLEFVTDVNIHAFASESGEGPVKLSQSRFYTRKTVEQGRNSTNSGKRKDALCGNSAVQTMSKILQRKATWFRSIASLLFDMRESWLLNRTFIYISLAVILTALELGCGGGKNDPPGTGVIPQVAHVFVLVEENHSYNQVIGNPAMPYTNMLAQKYALATQSHANRFNSLPNYFMLTVGSLITTNDEYTGTVTADNVARAVSKAGKTWKIYAESLPNIGYLGPTVYPYGKDHNPFAYFSDVIKSSSQAAKIVPFTQLATDMQNGTLPDYAMIVPNFENDGHDCPGGGVNCSD